MSVSPICAPALKQRTTLRRNRQTARQCGVTPLLSQLLEVFFGGRHTWADCCRIVGVRRETGSRLKNRATALGLMVQVGRRLFVSPGWFAAIAAKGEEKRRIAAQLKRERKQAERAKQLEKQAQSAYVDLLSRHIGLKDKKREIPVENGGSDPIAARLEAAGDWFGLEIYWKSQRQAL